MTLELLRAMLGWCAIVNIGILAFWFVCFAFARQLISRFHGRVFRLSPEQFDAMHYGMLALYKLLIIVFNLVPYLVLRVFISNS